MFSLDPESAVFERYYRSLSIVPVRIRVSDDINTLMLKFHDLFKRHFERYPFHSLHFNLENQVISLNRNTLIRQLMKDEGGSSYHHNALFQAILDYNGIKSWFIACLVHNPQNPRQTFNAQTHIAIILEHGNKQYLLDPGWDGTALCMYPLPDELHEVVRVGRHQVRRTADSMYPFSFEEVKDEESVVRYDFNCTPTRLEALQSAIGYLRSNSYAFHTLFLFTRLSSDGFIIQMINRSLIKKTLEGEVIFQCKLACDIAPHDKLIELFGAHRGLMASLNMHDFKNPDLGELICQAPELSRSASMSGLRS